MKWIISFKPVLFHFSWKNIKMMQCRKIRPYIEGYLRPAEDKILIEGARLIDKSYII